jgi:hypothetical protein
MRTGSAGASHEVSLAPFGVRWSRRTAWSLPPPSHPASALFRPRHPRQEVGSPMRFLAPHVWRCCSVACVARRRRAGHSWPISFGPPYRIRAGCYRDLTGTVKVPATPMGFTLHPSQFCFRPRVTTPHRRLGPTCRFGTCHREFHRRGVHRLWRCDRRFVAAASGVWPRGTNRAV